MSSGSELLRWIRWGALVLVFVVSAGALSAWQLDRRSERVAQIQLVVDNYDRLPVPLSAVTWLAPDGSPAAQEWVPVEITGSYIEGTERLVRNRPLAGRAGFLQLAAFRLSDGRVLIIERGWLPTGSDGGMPEQAFAISSADRIAIVRLRTGERSDPAASENGSVAAINLEYFASEFSPNGQVIEAFYGRLAAETPPDLSYPIAMPKPNLNEGNHLSYALQWLLFGLLAIVALVWAIRRDRIVASGASPKRHTGRIAEEDARAEDVD